MFQEFLSDQEIEQIHLTSMKLLTNVGVRFPDDEAIAVFNKHGVKTEGQLVYLTEEQVMRDLNPEYLRYVTPPDREVTIRVPSGMADAFRVNYASIPADKRVTWLIHVVTRGQTLGQIARRYGTSVAALRAANGNVNPRRIQIGQQLDALRGHQAPAQAVQAHVRHAQLQLPGEFRAVQVTRLFARRQKDRSARQTDSGSP